MNEDTIITGVYKFPAAYKYWVGFASRYGWKSEADGDPTDFVMNLIKTEIDAKLQGFAKDFVESKALEAVKPQADALQVYVPENSSVDKIIE